MLARLYRYASYLRIDVDVRRLQVLVGPPNLHIKMDFPITGQTLGVGSFLSGHMLLLILKRYCEHLLDG